MRPEALSFSSPCHCVLRAPNDGLLAPALSNQFSLLASKEFFLLSESEAIKHVIAEIGPVNSGAPFDWTLKAQAVTAANKIHLLHRFLKSINRSLRQRLCVLRGRPLYALPGY